MTMPLEEVLIKLKDINGLIDPNDTVRLIETVGMYIDDLDLEIISAELLSNKTWAYFKDTFPECTNAEINNKHRLSVEYQGFKSKGVLLKKLRRNYRLLNTKLNLITKPKGR